MKNSLIALFLLSYFAFSQTPPKVANPISARSYKDSTVLSEIKKSYSRQLGATFKMLEYTIDKANETTWTARINNMPFWQICYHVLWFTDFYFHANQATFQPQSFDMEGIHNYWIKPDSQMIENQKHPISKSNMKAYCKYVRQRANQFIQNINVTYFTTPSPFEWHGFPKIDLVDYNLRNLQHHIGQLDIVLRREQNIGNPWIMFGDLLETSYLPVDTSQSR
ncbi:MAG: DinB family protein [Bacteroidota bacterium]